MTEINRAQRRAQIRKEGSNKRKSKNTVAGLSLLATAGLMGSYISYVRPLAAAASTTCDVNISGGSGAIQAKLSDTDCAVVQLMGSGPVTLATTLTITRSVELVGNAQIEITPPLGASAVTVNASGATVKFRDLNFQGTGEGFVPPTEGGALLIQAALQVEITDSSFREFVVGSTSAPSAFGGAINVALDSGGRIAISGSEFVSNEVIAETTADGGAIWLNAGGGELIIEDSSFIDNQALRTNTGTNGGKGGAIQASNLSKLDISNSTFSGNSSDYQGGAIWGALRDTETTIDQTTFVNNSSFRGGALYLNPIRDETLTITRSAFVSNTAEFGGAAYMSVRDGEITVESSLFLGNVAPTRVDTSQPPVVDGGLGGALQIKTRDAATTNFLKTTFSRNIAGVSGGAIWSDKFVETANSTFYENEANLGSAVYSKNGAELSNVTVVGVDGTPMISVEAVSADVLAYNSIFAGDGPIFSGERNSFVGYSLLPAGKGTSFPMEGNIFSDEYQLGELGDNGGPAIGADGGYETLTMLPAEDSPVVDAGINGFTFGDVDQRGFARIVKISGDVATVDMGAVERQANELEDEDEDGDSGAGGATPFTGPIVTDPTRAAITPGANATVTGSRLEDVTGVTIGGFAATIVSKSATSLTFVVPSGLAAGTYDLVLTGSFGSVTVQSAFVVGSATSNFDSKDAWTQRQADGSVKVYAKNPIGAGKVQFFYNGREIAWVRAVDETDPKLRFRGQGYYLVRTVNLQPGKNVFEIYVEGERVRRAAYWVPRA